LKEAGVWTVGLASEAAARYDQIDFTLPSALVVGAEGAGLRRLVRERCDWLVSIPMRGHVESLNVSVAAGIVLFEAVRQRSGGQRTFRAGKRSSDRSQKGESRAETSRGLPASKGESVKAPGHNG
jgi:tRNA C32,U32 (ribose-2'-O)-methylase TrmJ